MSEGKAIKVKRPNGRPPKLVESDELLKQIEGLARIQCTQREAAAVLRVDEDTYNKFLGSHEKARAAWKSGLESGKASLRRLQYKNAENGSATMQIWLGKQWLEQADQAVNTIDVGATLGGLLGKLTGAVLPDHAFDHDGIEKTIPESIALDGVNTLGDRMKFQN